MTTSDPDTSLDKFKDAFSLEPLMGKNTNFIIQQLEIETGKSYGDQIPFDFYHSPRGDGFTRGERIEGNEMLLETENDSLVIDELSYAVRFPDNQTIDQQKAKNAIMECYAKKLESIFFLHVCGYTGRQQTTSDGTISLYSKHYGFNPILEPSPKRWILANNKKKESELVEGDGLKLEDIDKLLEIAELSDPKIRPVRYNGEGLLCSVSPRLSGHTIAHQYQQSLSNG